MNKFNLKKLIPYVIAFSVPIICTVIRMAIIGCYPFGEFTLLIEDANSQYYDYFNVLLDLVEDHKSILYLFNGGLGENFYVTYWYYLSSPLTFIVFICGKEYLELGVSLILLLQVGLCSATACYYFMHSRINKLPHGKLNKSLCVLFSLAYSMCSFFLAYQYHIIWLACLMMVPIVLLGIERLIYKSDWRLYTVSLFLCFIFNFYFAWYVCIFAVVWFIDQSRGSIKTWLRDACRFALYSMLAALSAAAVLLPCYSHVLGRNDVAWSSLSDYSLATFGSFGDFVMGFFCGYDIDTLGSATFANNNYCGVFVIFLALLYVFQKNKSCAQKIKRIVEIVFLAFSMNWIVCTYIFHGFSMPHSFSNRFAFILIFMLIITAFEALQDGINVHVLGLLGLFATFIAIVALAFLTASTDNVQSIFCYLSTILIFTYLFICTYLYKRGSIKQISLIMNILVIGIVELVANLYIATADDIEWLTYKAIEADEWSVVYDTINTDDGVRKSSFVNSTNIFSLSDASIYSSALNSNVLHAYKALGLSYQTNGGSYTYMGTTPLTAALLNVDYVLTDNASVFGGYAGETTYVTSEGVQYGIFETEYDTALAFMVSENILDWDTDYSSAFEVQNDFTKNVLEVGDIFESVTFDDLEVTCENAMMMDTTETSFSYLNFDFTFSNYAIICLSFTVDEDMDLYATFTDAYYALPYIYINGEFVSACNYPELTTLVHVGDLTAGTSVSFYAISYGSSVGDQGTLYMEFYKYNDDVMQECLEIMNEEPLEITSFSDTYIAGNVTAEEGEVLYTSIPYYKGWTVYVDGVATEVSLIADAFIGVELEAGEHVVEFKYFPYGLKLGIIMSLIGLCLVVILWRRYIKKGVEVSSPTPQDIP